MAASPVPFQLGSSASTSLSRSPSLSSSSSASSRASSAATSPNPGRSTFMQRSNPPLQHNAAHNPQNQGQREKLASPTKMDPKQPTTLQVPPHNPEGPSGSSAGNHSDHNDHNEDGEHEDHERNQTSPLPGGVENNQERRSLRRSISLRRDELRWEKQQRTIEELMESVESLERSLELEKAEKYKMQNTLEVALEQHKERSAVLQEELNKQLEKGVLLKRSLEQQQSKSAKLSSKLETSKEMLGKFQGCYAESLRKNESLSNMITPKCFDSMADYEFFVVSSHSEQLNTDIITENETFLRDLDATLSACKNDNNTFFTAEEIKNDLAATPTPLLQRKLSQYAKPEPVLQYERKSPGPVSPGRGGTLKVSGGKIEVKKTLERESSQTKLNQHRKSSMEPIHEDEVTKPVEPVSSLSRENSSQDLASTSSGNLRRNISSTSLKTKHPLRSSQNFKPEIYFPSASKYDFLLPSVIKNQPPKLS